MKRNNSRFLWLGVIVAGFLFTWYLWPTPWEVRAVDKHTVRIHRLTGTVQHLTSTGWLDQAAYTRIQREDAKLYSDWLRNGMQNKTP